MTHDMPTVLLTGFEPFDGAGINPSLEVARALDGMQLCGHRIVAGILPTQFSSALTTLEALIDAHAPALALCMGLAGGRAEIALERVAINLIDARIPDNAGAQPIDVGVVENAPNAYFSTLPVKAMLAVLREAGIASVLSHSAGTFVCNQVFFGLAHRIATRGEPPRGGFIHLPYLTGQPLPQADTPTLDLATAIRAVRLCLECALTTQTDLRVSGGSTH